MIYQKAKFQKGSIEDETGIILGLFLVLVLISLLVMKAQEFWTEQSGYFSQLLNQISAFLLDLYPFVKLFSFAVSVLLIFGIVYVARQYMRLVAEENKKYAPPPKSEVETKEFVNEKWLKIEEHISSDNPSDWKLAILEADIILDEMLDKMGYMGESVSEKLKRIEKSDFTNIENAWEAHKIRNMIAHEGSEFVINEREARRVIGLYKSVFEEFKYI